MKKQSKQRKTNAATQYSINNGDLLRIGGALYRGRNPVYKNIAAFGEPVRMAKVVKGIPFVRVDA